VTAGALPLPRPVRVLRSGMLAVTAATLAVAAHVAAGGELPDTASTILLTMLIGWAGTTVAHRRVGKPTMVAALAGTQTALHGMLTVVHHLSLHRPEPETVALVTDGRLMLAGHTLAVLLTGVVLAYADAAILAVLAAVHSALPTRPPPLAARIPLAGVVLPTVEHTATAVLLTRICGRRGPPSPA
jgi:hypothetical protein